MGFVQAWLDVVNFSICLLSASARAWNIAELLQLILYICFQSAAVMGGRFSNPLPAQSP